MKYGKLLVVGLFGLLFFSCSSIQEEQVRGLKVELSEDVLKASNEFSKIEFISLETKNENIVKKISRVIQKDSIYIIFSNSPDNCLARHNESGSLIGVIGRQGRGPEEIISFGAIHVDSCIWIYDRGRSRILKFQSDGSYLDNYKNVGFFNQMVIHGNILALYDLNDGKGMFQNKSLDYKVNLFDMSDKYNPKLIFSDIKRYPDRKNLRVQLSNNFNVSGNYLYYWTFPSETINRFNLESHRAEPYMSIELGSSGISSNFLDKPWKGIKDFIMEAFRKKLYYLNDFYALKRDVYCFRGRDLYIGFHHKKSNKLICNNKIKLFNIKELSPVTFDNKIELVGAISSNRVIFTWQAMDFIEYCKKARQLVSSADWENILSQYPGLKKTIRETTEESNPVLMIASLK